MEKERKERAKQLGLIRVEGSDGAEDTEREKRVFQLQMCEVRGFMPVKTPEALFLFTSHGWSVMFTPTFNDKVLRYLQLGLLLDESDRSFRVNQKKKR